VAIWHAKTRDAKFEQKRIAGFSKEEGEHETRLEQFSTVTIQHVYL
jgi:hypothetical protein